jgi:hypothetical protein
LWENHQASENKTQTQVDGGKEVYYASGPAPEYLQKGTGPKLRVVVFISRKAAASKQGVQKQTWQLAVQGYNISCQHSCGRRPSAVSGGIAACRGPNKGEGLYSSLILSLTLIFLRVSLSASLASRPQSQGGEEGVP